MSYLISEGAAPSTPASGKVAVYAKTDGRVYGKDDVGTEFNMSGITLGTPQATTSGSTKDFTSLPTGLKRISINISNLGTNGTSVPLIRVGDSGGFITTGYLSGATNATTAVTSVNGTTGFPLGGAWASTIRLHGTVVLSLLDSSTNLWSFSGSLGRSDTTGTHTVGGSVSLTNVLNSIRLFTSDTLTSGTINITYES